MNGFTDKLRDEALEAREILVGRIRELENELAKARSQEEAIDNMLVAMSGGAKSASRGGSKGTKRPRIKPHLKTRLAKSPGKWVSKADLVSYVQEQNGTITPERILGALKRLVAEVDAIQEDPSKGWKVAS